MNNITEVAISILALLFLTGWGDYERVECLSDQEQLPVYKVTVELEHREGSATVVIIAPGYALTAAHVVRSPVLSISVLTPKGPRAASVVSVDTLNDLALLTLDTRGLGYLPVYAGDLAPGRIIWTAGFPEEGGISFRGPLLRAEEGLLIVGALVFPGMSGGPVIVCEGGRPYMAGSISSFNYRLYRRWPLPRGGVHEEIVNTGTGNAVGGLLISVFIDYAIELYEEEREKKRK